MQRAARHRQDRADTDERFLLFSLVIVGNALEEDGPLDVLRRLWEDDLHGLEYAVISVLGSAGQAVLALPQTRTSPLLARRLTRPRRHCLPTLLKAEDVAVFAVKELLEFTCDIPRPDHPRPRLIPVRWPTR